MSHETKGKTDEWYTPKYIFDALGCTFDMDVASPVNQISCHVPVKDFILFDSLERSWKGFIWMNPPYGDEDVKTEWLKKFISHGNGIALMPDRTSTKWWQNAAKECDMHLQTSKKIKSIRSDGVVGNAPSNGTTLFAIGEQACEALLNAQDNGLGLVFAKM